MVRDTAHLRMSLQQLKKDRFNHTFRQTEMKIEESSELEDGGLFRHNFDLASACGSPIAPHSKLQNIFMQMGSKIKPVNIKESQRALDL